MRRGLSFWRRITLPPHSFPSRTELIRENVPFRSDDVVLEIGVGPGYNAYRLAPFVASWVGVDIAADLVRILPPAPAGDVRFIVGDATSPEFAREHAGRYSKIVSADALQGIPDHLGFFRTVGTALASGGRAYVTFPNDSTAGRTATAFRTRQALQGALASAGLEAVSVRTARAHPIVRAAKRYGVGTPSRLVRRMRTLGRPNRTDRSRDAARFDETFFHQIQTMGALPRCGVNLYMELLVAACKIFTARFFAVQDDPSIDPSRLWLELARPSSARPEPSV